MGINWATCETTQSLAGSLPPELRIVTNNSKKKNYSKNTQRLKETSPNYESLLIIQVRWQSDKESLSKLKETSPVRQSRRCSIRTRLYCWNGRRVWPKKQTIWLHIDNKTTTLFSSLHYIYSVLHSTHAHSYKDQWYLLSLLSIILNYLSFLHPVLYRCMISTITD